MKHYLFQHTTKQISQLALNQHSSTKGVDAGQLAPIQEPDLGFGHLGFRQASPEEAEEGSIKAQATCLSEFPSVLTAQDHMHWKHS